MKRKTGGLRRKAQWSCEVRAKKAAAPVNELASYYKSVLTVAVRGFQDWITDFSRQPIRDRRPVIQSVIRVPSFNP
jgi:hypothetical protein